VSTEDEEIKLMKNLIDVATAAVKRGDGDSAVQALVEALASAERLPKIGDKK